MNDSNSKNISDYIASCLPEVQPKLHALRKLILMAEPELKEKISWRMPTFYITSDVIHFAAHKNHIGIYPGPEVIEQFADRLQGYKFSKGAFQIPYDRPIDEALISDMIRYSLRKDSTDSV